MTRFEGDNSEGIMPSSHDGVPNHGSALNAGLFVCPFLPRFFHHIHLTRMPSLIQRLAQQGTGSSVVESSLARREASFSFAVGRIPVPAIAEKNKLFSIIAVNLNTSLFDSQ